MEVGLCGTSSWPYGGGIPSVTFDLYPSTCQAHWLGGPLHRGALTQLKQSSGDCTGGLVRPVGTGLPTVWMSWVLLLSCCSCCSLEPISWTPLPTTRVTLSHSPESTQCLPAITEGGASWLDNIQAEHTVPPSYLLDLLVDVLHLLQQHGKLLLFG